MKLNNNKEFTPQNNHEDIHDLMWKIQEQVKNNSPEIEIANKFDQLTEKVINLSSSKEQNSTELNEIIWSFLEWLEAKLQLWDNEAIKVFREQVEKIRRNQIAVKTYEKEQEYNEQSNLNKKQENTLLENESSNYVSELLEGNLLQRWVWKLMAYLLRKSWIIS